MNRHNFYQLDIRPDNILTDPETLQCRFIDFGLAKQIKNYEEVRFYKEIITQFPFGGLVVDQKTIKQGINYSSDEYVISNKKYLNLYQTLDTAELRKYVLQRADLYSLTSSILDIINLGSSLENLTDLEDLMTQIRIKCINLDHEATTGWACGLYYDFLKKHYLI